MIFLFIMISTFSFMLSTTVPVKENIEQKQLVKPFGICENYTHNQGTNNYNAEVIYCKKSTK